MNNIENMRQILFMLLMGICSLGSISCGTDNPIDEAEVGTSASGQSESSGEDTSGSANTDTAGTDESNTETNESNTETMNTAIIIRVGNTDFQATLEDNATARAFVALLPLTVDM